MNDKDRLLSILNPKQKLVFKDYLKHKPKITILHGAVRSSKTFLLNYLFLNHVAQFEGRGVKFIMTGYTISSLKKNVLDDWTDLFGIDTTLNSRNEFELWGNTMCCFGSDKVDSFKAMRGMTSFGHMGNEVTLSHKNSIDEAIKRCSGRGSKLFWDTNPDAPTHYIKKDYIDRQHELKDEQGNYRIRAYQFILEDNTKLDPAYVSNLIATTPSGLRYDRDILGLWVAAEGIVFADFIPAQMVIDHSKLPDLKRCWAGVDWGYEHWGAIIVIGEDYDGTLYICDEITAQHKDIDWWVKQRDKIKERWFINNSDFYCDTARPEYVRAFQGRNAKKEVMEGIAFCASYMKQNRFFITTECPRLIENMSQYIWKDTGTKEEPLKENDDQIDAMRYAIYTKLARNKAKPTNRPAGLR